MHLRLQVQLSKSEESLSKKYPCIADCDMCGLCKVFRGRDAEHAFDPTTEAIGGGHLAVSVGNVDADQDLVGSLAAEVVSEAVLRSVYSAESAYGLPAAADLGK